MKSASLTKDLEYNDNKPAVKVLMDTDSSREIRITMRKGQVMKEHKTPFPIVVEIFEGHITFGVNGETHNLVKGDLVYLEGSVPHDLKAEEDSTVRLTLSKSDTAERVKGVADSSSQLKKTTFMQLNIRQSRLEYAKPVTIGMDVWIGGSAVICPGVTIGDRTVIGAGSVVTKDLPSDVFAAGNPCKVIRSLEEE